MRIEDLKDGRRYRLTRDVVNPRLDKRERYAPEKLAWREGDVFRCSRWNKADTEGCRVKLDALIIQSTPRNAIGSIYSYHEGFQPLIDALEELPESARDVCARHSIEPREALRKLFEMKLITIEQVEQACIAVREEPEA